MLKSIQDRETGKVNVKKKLTSNLDKIRVLEDRVDEVNQKISEAELSLLSLENEEVNMYDDYLDDQFVNTENVPSQVLMIADTTIPLYDELERLIKLIDERKAIEETKIPRITQELVNQE